MKNQKQQITFILIEKSNDGANNITFHYKDESGHSLIFIETNRAWEYKADTINSDPIYQNKNYFKKLIDGYQMNSINRNDFKGGYEEAISKVTIII